MHGDITLTGEEAWLLDAPEVQRLRWVQQLGTAYLVYPGCRHSRFEHALGTLAAAGRILAGLRAAGFDVAPEVERAVRAAALLHDVTHVPFGHTLEDERGLLPRHDRGPRLGLLLRGELGRRLERLGLLGPVREILEPESGEERAAGGGLPPWARELVAGTVDADLLDYLRRDAYYAGLKPDYDDRVYRYFVLDGGHLALNLQDRGIDRPDARSEVIQVLRTRYFLTERVYFHHAKVASGAMVSRAVETVLEAGGVDEERLLRLGDQTLLEWLAGGAGLRSGARETVAGLARALLERRLLKRAYVLTARSTGRDERAELTRLYWRRGEPRRRLEAELAGEAGLAEGWVVVWCAQESAMKEARVRVVSASGRRELDGPEVEVLDQAYRGLWRLYVFAPREARTRVEAAAARRFGRPSELQPPS
ncbi:MAG: HD domain-containing protein [Clostridia bacterium]|nr:HD domain-containing protein [Clostridia bacterium]